MTRRIFWGWTKKEIKEYKELEARRNQEALELMVMRHEAVTRYQEGMDKHDVIDPLAGVMY